MESAPGCESRRRSLLARGIGTLPAEVCKTHSNKHFPEVHDGRLRADRLLAKSSGVTRVPLHHHPATLPPLPVITRPSAPVLLLSVRSAERVDCARELEPDLAPQHAATALQRRPSCASNPIRFCCSSSQIVTWPLWSSRASCPKSCTLKAVVTPATDPCGGLGPSRL